MRKFIKVVISVVAVLIVLFVCAAVFLPPADPQYAQQRRDAIEAREIRTQVDSIVAEIMRSGPPEIHRVSESIVRDTVQTFVIGQRTGVISDAQLSRMGGIKGATISSIQGQLKVLGY
jgi:hypothetical protein